jgi:hypothetical protein
MVRYSPLMTESEFARFHTLMTDLAPYLMLLIIDPAKTSNHRRDRNPGIDRRNLQLILYGDPRAVPLFE